MQRLDAGVTKSAIMLKCKSEMARRKEKGEVLLHTQYDSAPIFICMCVEM